MLKRAFDLTASFAGLLIASPVLVATIIAIWRQDFHSPFYIAPRVGKNGRLFKMVKLRSMVVNADKTGVDSTSDNDQRITAVGRFVRSYKLDEVAQLWNVFIGDMALVGPRPNVKRETDLYTIEEQKLLTVKPGITDLASIVFADEGDILKGSLDPDIDYNQKIRPWKSRLALLYVENQSLLLDVKIIYLTLLTMVDRQKALTEVQNILRQVGADEQLMKMAGREVDLIPFPPPGSDKIVVTRS